MSGRGWGRGVAPRTRERRPSPSPTELGLAARFLSPRAQKPVQRDLSPEATERRNRLPLSGGHGARPGAEKSGGGTVTTHNEALSDYRRFRARQAGVAADTPPGRLGPDPEHAAALTHASMLLVPSYRREQQKQRAAAAEAERRAGMPEPREVLREAHRMRAEAQAEADRLHTAVERARQHHSEAFEARDAAKRQLEVVEAEHTERLLDTLSAGGSPGRVEPVAGEKRVALADAEHQVEIASRAVDKLAGDLAAAQQRLEPPLTAFVLLLMTRPRLGTSFSSAASISMLGLVITVAALYRSRLPGHSAFSRCCGSPRCEVTPGRSGACHARRPRSSRLPEQHNPTPPAATSAVTGAVCAVLLSEAERQAVEILREVEALDDKRRALDGLAVEISNRQRTGGPARPVWPPQIREALFAPACGRRRVCRPRSRRSKAKAWCGAGARLRLAWPMIPRPK